MNTTLLIMAAGIGNRFGTGIKQLEPVGLHNEITAKKLLPPGLQSKILYLYQHWHKCFFNAEILPFCAKNHL